jgi:hypothetical protein
MDELVHRVDLLERPSELRNLQGWRASRARRAPPTIWPNDAGFCCASRGERAGNANWKRRDSMSQTAYQHPRAQVSAHQRSDAVSH